MEQYGELQILPPLRLPGVRATALPCRLVIGNDNADIRTPLILQPTIRGVCLVNMNNLKIHNLTAKIKKIREIREIRAKN